MYLQAQKASNYQCRLLYPAKLFFVIKGERHVFHYEHKVWEFMATVSPLEGILNNGEKEKFP